MDQEPYTPHPDVQGFWEKSPQLAFLHQRAESLMVSPWALLATTLANVVSHIPPGVQSTDGGTMNLIVGLTGRPGSGFTTTLSAAEEIVFALGKIAGFPPLKFCLEELWSGGQRYDFPSASLNLDNHMGLAQLFRDQGPDVRSRTLDMLDGKSIPLPHGGAFPEGAYRVTLRESLYPGSNAAWLFQEAQLRDGIPDRYLIAPLWWDRHVRVAAAPAPPLLPVWSAVPPGPVPVGVGIRVPSSGDQSTRLRNRVSVALAALHGRTVVSRLDWDLSEAPVQVSLAVSAEMRRAATAPRG